MPLDFLDVRSPRPQETNKKKFNLQLSKEKEIKKLIKRPPPIITKKNKN